jgi:hypothetical protein
MVLFSQCRDWVEGLPLQELTTDWIYVDLSPAFVTVVGVFILCWRSCCCCHFCCCLHSYGYGGHAIDVILAVACCWLQCCCRRH